MLEGFVEECKNDYKDGGYYKENAEDIAPDINEEIDDVHECCDDFEDRGEKS